MLDFSLTFVNLSWVVICPLKVVGKALCEAQRNNITCSENKGAQVIRAVHDIKCR